MFLNTPSFSINIFMGIIKLNQYLLVFNLLKDTWSTDGYKKLKVKNTINSALSVLWNLFDFCFMNHLNTVICFFFLYHTWCCNIAVWCCIICCCADRPWFCCCSNCCICWGSNPCCAAIIIRGCWLPELSSMALLDLTLRLAALWLEVGELGVGEKEPRTRWTGLLSSASRQRGECPCKRR